MRKKKGLKLLLTAALISNYLSPFSLLAGRVEAAEYLPSCEEKTHSIIVQFEEGTNVNKIVYTEDASFEADANGKVVIPLEAVDEANTYPGQNGFYMQRTNGVIKFVQTPSYRGSGSVDPSFIDYVKATISLNNESSFQSMTVSPTNKLEGNDSVEIVDGIINWDTATDTGFDEVDFTYTKSNCIYVELNAPTQTGYENQNAEEFACSGDFTNVNGVKVKWSDVSTGIEGVKYQRQYKVNSGGWTGNEIYLTNETNYRTFGGNPGNDGIYGSRVRAFYDENDNNVVDANEVVSGWSNECSISYDTTEPIIEWVQPEDGSIHNNIFTMKSSSNEILNNARFKWRKEDETEWTQGDNLNFQGTEYQYEFNPGEDGVYVLRAQGRDLALNWNRAEDITVTYDSTAPAQPTMSTIYKGHGFDGEDLGCDGVTNETKITIDWEANTEEDLAGYWFGTQFNTHHKWVPADQSHYMGNMTPNNNPYYYTVIAVDKAGNESVISLPCGDFTLDQDKPTVPGNLTFKVNGEDVGCGAYTNEYTVVADWDESTDVTTNVVYYNYRSYNPEDGWIWTAQNPIYTTERKGSFTVGEGTYGFAVKSVDLAGNESDWSSTNLEESCTITYDITAPATPTGLHRRSVDGSATYECGDFAQRQTLIPDWDDNTEADFSHYEYTSFNVGGVVGLDEKVLTESEMVHNWVAPVDGTYGFAVRAVDKAGNKSAWALGGTETIEDSCQITYDSTAPEVPELISPKDGSIVNGNPTQTWEAVDDAKYYIYASYRDEDCTDQIYTTKVNGTSRTVGGTQTINIWWRVKAVDAAGNESDWSDAWNLNIDNTKPEIALELPTDGSLQAGDINLQALCNEECDYINFWWRAEDQEYSNVSPDRRYHYVYEDGTEFNWTLNTLDAERWGTDENYVMEDGTYYFYAAGKDVAGNWARSQEVMVIVDNSAPIAVITLPSDGDKVTGIVDIYGYVYDDNLSHYNISINPGDADVHDFSLRLEDETVYTNEFDNKFLYSWDTTQYEDGEYQIRLAARDLAGNRELDSEDFDGVSEHIITVIVDHTAPTAEIEMTVEEVETNEVNEGQEATFTLVNVSEDAVSYVWAFDGVVDETLTGTTATHTWGNNSTHLVEVTVTDDLGNAATYELEVTVNNVAPTLEEIEDVTITLGNAVDFTAVATDPSFGEDADLLTYTWDMGDGTVLSGESVSDYEYTETGAYTVTLTVSDNDYETEGTDTITFIVNVGTVQGAFTTAVLGASNSSVLGASTETLARTGSTIAWIIASMGLMLVGGSVYTLRRKNK